MSRSELEALTRTIGREIFARLEADRPLPLTPAWWDERLMAWSMADPALKAQLFRFIDVLPTLRSPAQITGHLREYLKQLNGQLPPLARFAMQHLPPDGVLGRLVATLARSNAARLARRFISGSNLAEALATIARMRAAALGFTIDLLGEAVRTASEAIEYQRSYLELIDGMAREVNRWPEVPLIDRAADGPLPRVNVSLKLSSLYSQFDPIDPVDTSGRVRERLRPILRLARQRGAFVNVDMEQFAYKDLTLEIFREILCEPEFRDWPDVGIALQAYLPSTADDLAGLAHWAAERGTPVWVRLVKGAYWDYETVMAAQRGWPVPVFTEKAETDANFEALTRFLMEHHGVLRPAIGSHNIRSIAYALACARLLGLPPRSFEFQMLYGMADSEKRALVEMGQRVRVYTPFGQLLPGMAYLVRRLLENTANESFLRATFTEHVPEEQLLMNPLDRIRRVDRASARPASLAPPDRFTNEPLSDFSQAEPRDAMRRGLDRVAREFGRVYPLVLGGRRTETPGCIESLDPSHRRQVVGRSSRARVEDARQAVDAARHAFPAWRDTRAEERAACLFRSAAILRRRRHELAAWEVCECAKQWREADADVAEAIDYCEYYAREMLRLAQPIRRDLPGEQNEYFYEPRGVALIIAPWNFPLGILCGMTAAALVTGNTAVMKPAEQSPVVAAKLMEALEEAGVPPGVVNYLPGIGEEIGPTLVGHPDVALIAFTGSRAVGLWINAEAAETPPGQTHVKRVIAEMGGKNAILIDEDADLDEAIHGVTASAFGYQGQKCSAAARVIVLDSVHDLFLNRLVEATRSLNIGPAEDPRSFVGPLIDQEARERVLHYIARGTQEARLVYAADVAALADEGFYVGPHIFADVPPSATIAQEEIFGPVLAVLRARDIDEAIRIANDTPYALTGGLYSRSPAHIARVRREFRVGNLYINRSITGALVERQPFGGFALSGVGSKAGGPDYLLQFLLPRVITENTMRHGFAPIEADQTAETAAHGI